MWGWTVEVDFIEDKNYKSTMRVFICLPFSTQRRRRRNTEKEKWDSASLKKEYEKMEKLST